MSIIYNDTQEKSDLQRRISAELREKRAGRPLNGGAKIDSQFDDLGDADYVKDLKPTTTLAWAWVIIAIAVVALLIFIAVNI